MFKVGLPPHLRRAMTIAMIAAQTKVKPGTARGELAASKAGSTAAKLVSAAAAEFREHGFQGTDTNKIARRAGFAPQTFYRWFTDKTEIFITVYRHWEEDERDVLAELMARGASASDAAAAVVAHHRKFRVFRRSLRLLSLEDVRARKARAESRLRQMARFRDWGHNSPGLAQMSDAALAAWLLQFERLCDAAAENEFTDMKIKQADALAEIARHAALLWPQGAA